MEIQVDRYISDDETTISRVSVDGNFVCYGLEDEYREDKIVGETRIPAGRYQVRLRTEGGHHLKYQKRFPDIHRGMLHIQNVPNFEWILIHCGNTDADTMGCLLVGSQANTQAGNMSISDSSGAYRKFYPMVVDAAAAGDLSINYQDNDR